MDRERVCSGRNVDWGLWAASMQGGEILRYQCTTRRLLYSLNGSLGGRILGEGVMVVVRMTKRQQGDFGPCFPFEGCG